jgi:hypothetical protein
MGRQVDPNNLGQNHSQCIWKHKIIIPQEEPKQYTSEELEGFEDFKKMIKPKQEYVKCTCANSLEYSNCDKKCVRILDEQEEPEISDEAKERAKNYMALKGALEVKEQTLKEVNDNRKNLYFKKQVLNPYSVKEYSYTVYEKGFIEGYEESTNWQSERMYSEEYMCLLVAEYQEYLKRTFHPEFSQATFKQWFEQHKKK